jgi:hypothetical protein
MAPTTKTTTTAPAAPTAEELTRAGLSAAGVPETEDVVQMASLNKDGEPDQSAGYKFLDPVAGEELLTLQKESQATGKDMVREKGPDVIRAARDKAKK